MMVRPVATVGPAAGPDGPPPPRSPMSESRDTAYGPVYGFAAFLVLVLLALTVVRQPNPKVRIVLTYPPAVRAK